MGVVITHASHANDHEVMTVDKEDSLELKAQGLIDWARLALCHRVKVMFTSSVLPQRKVRGVCRSTLQAEARFRWESRKATDSEQL